MTIGTLGDITFAVNAKEIKTIENMSWKSSASYATHKLFGKKAILEFTGINPDKISFNVEFSVYLGINPQKSMKKLENMLNKGTAATFVLGTKTIGTKWVLTDIDRTIKHFDNNGDILSYEVKITIEEYAGA